MAGRRPGVTKPGSVCSELVISVDFFPTFLGILGIVLEAKGPIDGVSLVPLLAQSGPHPQTSLRVPPAIYWHYPHYHSSSIGPCGAVRCGDYKLIEWFGETICGPGNRFELYNLKKDIAEQNNLTKEMPEKTKELKKMLESWRNKVNAQMLTPNPNYNPKKAKKSKRQK